MNKCLDRKRPKSIYTSPYKKSRGILKILNFLEVKQSFIISGRELGSYLQMWNFLDEQDSNGEVNEVLEEQTSLMEMWMILEEQTSLIEEVGSIFRK